MPRLWYYSGVTHHANWKPLFTSLSQDKEVACKSQRVEIQNGTGYQAVENVLSTTRVPLTSMYAEMITPLVLFFSTVSMLGTGHLSLHPYT